MEYLYIEYLYFPVWQINMGVKCLTTHLSYLSVSVYLLACRPICLPICLPGLPSCLPALCLSACMPTYIPHCRGTSCVSVYKCLKLSGSFHCVCNMRLSWGATSLGWACYVDERCYMCIVKEGETGLPQRRQGREFGLENIWDGRKTYTQLTA